MIQIDATKVLYERGDAGFKRAWNTLQKAGENPERWMYMFSEAMKDGSTVHTFKNTESRLYHYFTEWAGGEAA